MKKIERQGALPHSVTALFNALTDFRGLPAVFPAVKAATVLAQGPGFADVEMEFNLDKKAASFLGNNRQAAHITWTPDHKEMHIAGTAGVLKTLAIHWRFNEAAANRTQVKFTMEYDTGMGFPKDMIANSFINNGTKDIIAKLGQHAARKPSGP